MWNCKESRHFSLRIPHRCCGQWNESSSVRRTTLALDFVPFIYVDADQAH